MEKYIQKVIDRWDENEMSDAVDNQFSLWSLNGRFVSYFSSELSNIIRDKVSGRKDDIIEKIVDVFHKKVYTITVRTMILEINQWKEEKGKELDGMTPNEKYLGFCRIFREADCFKKFCQKYPVLIHKIYLFHTYTLHLLDSAVSFLLSDKVEIEETLGFNVNQIHEIELSDGDRHNNGKAALIFSDNKGKKILYKPHGLSNDLFLSTLFETLNVHFKLDLIGPKVVNRKDYGWQEFIQKKQCSNEEQYKRYYYRYGELLGIAYCLNMTDIHMENLITYGEYPVIIDTETIISNDSYNLDQQKVAAVMTDTPQKLFNHVISKSVINTLLVPTNLLGGIFDVDLSPLAVEDSQKSEKITTFRVVDEFTDEIRFEAECYELKNTETVDIKHNGSAYLKEIMDGFTECYLYVLKNREKFLDSILDNAKVNKLVVRQVLRPTYVYAKFEDASNHPDYLTDINSQVNLFYKLKAKMYQQDKKLSKQVDMEVLSLLNDDIPYFYTEADSKSLQCIYGSIDDFYKRNILDLVRERILFMNEEDLISQQRIISLSMSTLLNSNWDRRENISIDGIKKYMYYLREQDTDLVEAVADYICHEARWDGTKAFCVIASHAILSPKLKVSPLNYNLYDGGGVVIFLYNLAYKSSNKKYLKVAKGLLEGFERMFDERVECLSAYTGVGSMLYIYYSLYQLYKEEFFYEKYQKYLDIIERKEIIEQQKIDYIGGLAGMAVLVENIYRKEKDERLVKMAEKYVDYCVEHLNEMKLTGLAHGYSGISLAVAGYYEISKKEQYRKIVQDLITLENQFFDEEKHNWMDLREDAQKNDPVFWCHGATGICLARLKCYEYTKLEVCKNDIQRSLRKIKEYMMSLTDHSLCHGMFGNIDCLVSCKELIQDDNSEISVLLEEKYKAVIDTVKENGIVCGISNAYDMFSLMLGISGVAYAIMRKHNKHLPSMLLLEC